MTTIKVFSGNIGYKEYGDAADAVLCLHGNSSSAGAFDGIARRLAGTYRVICMDFPGHGDSDGGRFYSDYFSFSGLAKVLLQFIGKAELTIKAIVGHSLGGHVAMRAIDQIPSLQSLVLISSPPIANRRAPVPFFREAAPLGSIFAAHLSEQDVTRLARDFSGPNRNNKALNRLIADIRNTDGSFRELLGASLKATEGVDELQLLQNRTGLRTMLIGGSDDSFINDNYYEWLKTQLKLPQERYHLLKGVGHYPHLESPAQTERLVGTFLAAESQVPPVGASSGKGAIETSVSAGPLGDTRRTMG